MLKEVEEEEEGEESEEVEEDKINTKEERMKMKASL